jgi:2-polyprenyl-6-methoxyphenol hydroxylase-like FAD-dependent oxidoreductase
MITDGFDRPNPKRHLTRFAGFRVAGAKPKKPQYSQYLDTISQVLSRSSQRLAGYNIVVIGAGPAGLVLARTAALQGATVQVLEKAGDPRTDDAGYTNRSFNLTLDDVGRAMLADERALRGGTWLRGRAIHNYENSDQIRYADYGETPQAHLVSIPRPVLRQNLCSLAEVAGVKLTFRAQITATDCDASTVSFRDQQGLPHTVQADLISFCDGVHSLADPLLRSAGALIERWPEQRRYVSGLISPAMNDNISTEYIHFWHERNQKSFTIGIPNADQSVACLLVSSFSDVLPGDKPFTSTETYSRLEQDFPRLYQSAPDVAVMLTAQMCGRFWYKSVNQYRVGRRGILAGDSGGAFPPWAGFGANQSMFSACLLVYLLARYNRNKDKALNEYEQQQLSLANCMKAFVAKQGDFLSGPVVEDPAGRSDPALGPLIWQAYLATHNRVHPYLMTKPRRRALMVADKN